MVRADDIYKLIRKEVGMTHVPGNTLFSKEELLTIYAHMQKLKLKDDTDLSTEDGAEKIKRIMHTVLDERENAPIVTNAPDTAL